MAEHFEFERFLVPESDNLTGLRGRPRMRDRDAAIAAEAERGTKHAEIARMFDMFDSQVSMILRRWNAEHREM